MALDDLVVSAQGRLEAALRGASLCSVSRDPRQGASDVKFHEGRWYTLRDVQRLIAGGQDPGSALEQVATDINRRTPAGPAWATYREGAETALQDARRALGATD